MKPELMNKWCKTTCSSEYYIKVKQVKEIEGQVSYNILYGECVTLTEKGYEYREKGSWFNTDFENSMVEVPLSEILQYLPKIYHTQIFKTYI